MKKLERPRGFWAVGIYHAKNEHNVGGLFRSALAFGAQFIFTVGPRYRHQSTDTFKTPRHVPLFHFKTLDDLGEHLPWSCQLVGVELASDSRPLTSFNHPERACYLLGAEDHGLPASVLSLCHQKIVIPTAEALCLNVATAGSIVMYDRALKEAA